MEGIFRQRNQAADLKAAVEEDLVAFIECGNLRGDWKTHGKDRRCEHTSHTDTQFNLDGKALGTAAHNNVRIIRENPELANCFRKSLRRRRLVI